MKKIYKYPTKKQGESKMLNVKAKDLNPGWCIVKKSRGRINKIMSVTRGIEITVKYDNGMIEVFRADQDLIVMK